MCASPLDLKAGGRFAGGPLGSQGPRLKAQRSAQKAHRLQARVICRAGCDWNTSPGGGRQTHRWAQSTPQGQGAGLYQRAVSLICRAKGPVPGTGRHPRASGMRLASPAPRTRWAGREFQGRVLKCPHVAGAAHFEGSSGPGKGRMTFDQVPMRQTVRLGLPEGDGLHRKHRTEGRCHPGSPSSLRCALKSEMTLKD